jgi:hypothetical protein
MKLWSQNWLGPSLLSTNSYASHCDSLVSAYWVSQMKLQMLQNNMIHIVSSTILLLIFTFECCILLRIYLTGSLWRRQSQQSFNTLTPFNFLFDSLHVFAPTGHPQVRYIISYYLFLKDYFNTTDPLHVCNFDIGMLSCSPNTMLSN